MHDIPQIEIRFPVSRSEFKILNPGFFSLQFPSPDIFSYQSRVQKYPSRPCINSWSNPCYSYRRSFKSPPTSVDQLKMVCFLLFSYVWIITECIQYKYLFQWRTKEGPFKGAIATVLNKHCSLNGNCKTAKETNRYVSAFTGIVCIKWRSICIRHFIGFRR